MKRFYLLLSGILIFSCTSLLEAKRIWVVNLTDKKVCANFSTGTIFGKKYTNDFKDIAPWSKSDGHDIEKRYMALDWVKVCGGANCNNCTELPKTWTNKKETWTHSPDAINRTVIVRQQVKTNPPICTYDKSVRSTATTTQSQKRSLADLKAVVEEQKMKCMPQPSTITYKVELVDMSPYDYVEKVATISRPNGTKIDNWGSKRHVKR